VVDKLAAQSGSTLFSHEISEEKIIASRACAAPIAANSPLYVPGSEPAVFRLSPWLTGACRSGRMRIFYHKLESVVRCRQSAATVKLI
jgi:hypothetical protein